MTIDSVRRQGPEQFNDVPVIVYFVGAGARLRSADHGVIPRRRTSRFSPRSFHFIGTNSVDQQTLRLN